MSAFRSVSMLRLSRASVAPRAVVASRSLSTLQAGRTAAPRVNVVVAQVPQVFRRGYAASSGLSTQEIQNRIFDVLKSFEKVDPAKVDAAASFTHELGLDSLDAVEVVMAIEEEFAIEIPDAEADNITTIQQAIDYIAKTPSAH